MEQWNNFFFSKKKKNLKTNIYFLKFFRSLYFEIFSEVEDFCGHFRYRDTQTHTQTHTTCLI